jgi:hypothetical protein
VERAWIKSLPSKQGRSLVALPFFMNLRMLYLREFAEVMGQNYERILKKEAQYFIEFAFEHMEIVSRGDLYSMFGGDVSLLTGKRIRSRNMHFEFKHEHCHAIFNDAVPYDNNIMLLLRHEFGLDKEEIQASLSRAVKKFLRENNIEVMRKVKVFSGPLKH